MPCLDLSKDKLTLESFARTAEERALRAANPKESSESFGYIGCGIIPSAAESDTRLYLAWACLLSDLPIPSRAPTPWAAAMEDGEDSLLVRLEAAAAGHAASLLAFANDPQWKGGGLVVHEVSRAADGQESLSRWIVRNPGLMLALGGAAPTAK